MNIVDVHPWQPQSTSIMSRTQRGFQIRFHTNSQTLSSLLHSSPGASSTMLHCCTQPGQFRKLSLRNIVSWVQSATSLVPTRRHPSLQAAPLLAVSSAVSASAFFTGSDVHARGAQDIADVYVVEQPFTMDSKPIHVGASPWFLSCAFWICLQVAGVCW